MSGVCDSVCVWVGGFHGGPLWSTQPVGVRATLRINDKMIKLISHISVVRQGFLISEARFVESSRSKCFEEMLNSIGRK